MTEQPESAVETICGAPMPDRLWLVDMGSGDATWSAERNPDGEEPLEAVEYVRLAAQPAEAQGAGDEAYAQAQADHRLDDMQTPSLDAKHVSLKAMALNCIRHGRSLAAAPKRGGGGRGRAAAEGAGMDQAALR